MVNGWAKRLKASVKPANKWSPTGIHLAKRNIISRVSPTLFICIPWAKWFSTALAGTTSTLVNCLEKFDVNVHVYRVGDYKSAVEPLQRNDMSPDARMAAEVLYQSIWQQLLQDLAANRELALPALQRYSDHLGQALKAAGGDMARAALEAYLVDELMTADQVNARLADDVGYQDTHLMEVNGVDYLGYLNARQSQPNHESEKQNSRARRARDDSQ